MNRSLQMGKECADTCVLFKCSSKERCPAEVEFNNQIHWMAHFVDCICLFSQTFLSLLIGQMNKAAMVTDIGVIHGLNNMDFHSLSQVRLQLPLRHRYGTSS